MAKTRFKDTQWIPTFYFRFSLSLVPRSTKGLFTGYTFYGPLSVRFNGVWLLKLSRFGRGGGVRGLDSCALVPYPLSPIPFLFLFFPIPFNHFRRLLRRLKQKDMETTMNYLPRQRQQNGNKTTRLKGALDFFWFGEGDNAMYLIVLCSKEFVNFVIHKFPLSLGSSGSF